MIVVKDNLAMAFIDIKNIKLLEEFKGDLKISFNNSSFPLKIFGVALGAFESLVVGDLEEPSDLHILEASFIILD